MRLNAVLADLEGKALLDDGLAKRYAGFVNHEEHVECLVELGRRMSHQCQGTVPGVVLCAGCAMKHCWSGFSGLDDGLA